MNTYRVLYGLSTENVLNIYIVRANNCAEAQKKVNKLARKRFDIGRVVQIEELNADFIA